MQLFGKYSRHFARLCSLLLIVSLSMTGVQATESSGTLADLENKRQETIDEINDLKDSISDVQKELEDLKSEKTSIQSYINKLDGQINDLTVEITEFEQKIAAKEADIEQTKVKLEEAKTACEEQYDSMKKRIQYFYENSGKTWLEMLLESGSIAELINRAGNVLAISSCDRDKMQELTETKENIALQEEILNAELEELGMMRQELEAQKKKVNSSINAKKGELSSKTAQIGDASEEQEDYEKQLEEQEKLLDEIEEQIAKAAQPDVYDGEMTGFIWPCPSYTRISSYFGPRQQPVPGASTNHKGVDLAAPYGSDILAAASGVVTTSKYSASAGNYVVIAHGNGVSTVYMHASSLLVSVGETVTQGQVIAKVGSTGYSSGNHLHFGVIKNGSYVDPLGYI